MSVESPTRVDRSTETAIGRLEPERSARVRSAILIASALAVFCIVTFLIPALLLGDPYANHRIVFPRAVINPPIAWVFNDVVPIVGVLVFARLTLTCVRRRTLTWNWLFFVGGVSCFWVETMADWGINLTYSPQFRHWHFFISFPWHVYDNPLFMPFAYGLYWGTFPAVVLRLMRPFEERGWGHLKALALVGIPFSICWDLLVEGTATYFGWWQYQPPIGPHFSWAALGGRGLQPLLVPAFLMTIWPNVCAWMAGDPRDGTSPRIRRLFRIPTRREGGGWDFGYESLKLSGWIAVFWLAQVTQLYPIIAVRYLFGHPNPFAPFPH